MSYMNPSHDIFHMPGDEGSCPSMPTESIAGKDFPNGNNDSVPMLGEINLPDMGDTRNYSGGHKSDPAPKKVGHGMGGE